MKKTISLILLSLCLLFVGGPFVLANQLTEVEIANQAGNQLPNDYQPKGGTIVIDADTGQILFERQIDTPWNAASLTKLMTMYLAYEALENGTLSKDQVFEVAQKYVEIGQNYALSNNNMILGAQYSFDELMKLMVVPSSNAATILMADTITNGDETLFIKMMNDKAKELGMTQSIFYNATGPRNEFLVPYAPPGQPLDGDNVISARDYAILNYHFLKKYPQFLEHTSQYHITVKPGTIYEETFKGYQHSLPDGPTPYAGTDGLKTGSSDSAGYNYVSTVKVGETRLILVMLGVGSWPDDNAELGRNLMGNAISDLVFNAYEHRLVLAQGEHEINGQKVLVESDLYDTVPRKSEPEFVLEDGKVSVKQTNPYVHPDMSAPSVPYRDVEQLKETKPSSSASNLTWLGMSLTENKLLLLISLVAVLLLVIVISLFVWQKKKRQQRQRRSRRSRRRYRD